MANRSDNTVYKIYYNPNAFEIICRANYHLSILEAKQRLIQDVITNALNDIRSLPPTVLDLLRHEMPLYGDVAIHLRLDSKNVEALNGIHAKANDATGGTLAIRDTLIGLCLMTIEKTA